MLIYNIPVSDHSLSVILSVTFFPTKDWNSSPAGYSGALVRTLLGARIPPDFNYIFLLKVC